MKENGKIFCIGLNKTGTTSLHEAFKILGLKSVHYVCKKGNIKKIIESNHENGNELLKGIEDFDAYVDWSFPATNNLFKEFDRQYLNSKFILNTRNMGDWIVSREKHVLRDSKLKKRQKEAPDNPWFSINKEAWEAEFEEHHKDVYEYFRNREKDLLVIDVTKGDGWEKLCEFLNVEIPNKPFPNANTAKSIKILKKIKARIKNLLGIDR